MAPRSLTLSFDTLLSWVAMLKNIPNACFMRPTCQTCHSSPLTHMYAHTDYHIQKPTHIAHAHPPTHTRAPIWHVWEAPYCSRGVMGGERGPSPLREGEMQGISRSVWSSRHRAHSVSQCQVSHHPRFSHQQQLKGNTQNGRGHNEISWMQRTNWRRRTFNYFLNNF